MADLESSYMGARRSERSQILSQIREDSQSGGDTVRHAVSQRQQKEIERVQHLGDKPETEAGESLWDSKKGHFHYHRDVHIPHVSDLPPLQEPVDPYYMTPSDYAKKPDRKEPLSDPSDGPLHTEEPLQRKPPAASKINEMAHAQYKARYDYDAEMVPSELGGGHDPHTGRERIKPLHCVDDIVEAWPEHVGRGGHKPRGWHAPQVWPPTYPPAPFEHEEEELRALEREILVTPMGEKPSLRKEIREHRELLEDLEHSHHPRMEALPVPWGGVPSCTTMTALVARGDAGYITRVLHEELPKPFEKERAHLIGHLSQTYDEDASKGRSRGDPYTRWQTWLPSELQAVQDPYKKPGGADQGVVEELPQTHPVHQNVLVGRGLLEPVSVETRMDEMNGEERQAVVLIEESASRQPYDAMGKRLEEHMTNLARLHAERDHDARQIGHMANEKQARTLEAEAAHYARKSVRRWGPYKDKEGNLQHGYHQVWQEKGLPGIEEDLNEERHHCVTKHTTKEEHLAAAGSGPPLMDHEGYRSLNRRPTDLRPPVKNGVPAELCGGFHQKDPREETDPRGYGAGPELGATVVMTDHNEDAAVRRARDALRQGALQSEAAGGFQGAYVRKRAEVWGPPTTVQQAARHSAEETGPELDVGPVEEATKKLDRDEKPPQGWDPRQTFLRQYEALRTKLNASPESALPPVGAGSSIKAAILGRKQRDEVAYDLLPEKVGMQSYQPEIDLISIDKEVDRQVREHAEAYDEIQAYAAAAQAETLEAEAVASSGRSRERLVVSAKRVSQDLDEYQDRAMRLLEQQQQREASQERETAVDRAMQLAAEPSPPSATESAPVGEEPVASGKDEPQGVLPGALQGVLESENIRLRAEIDKLKAPPAPARASSLSDGEWLSEATAVLEATIQASRTNTASTSRPHEEGSPSKPTRQDSSKECPAPKASVDRPALSPPDGVTSALRPLRSRGSPLRPLRVTRDANTKGLVRDAGREDQDVDSFVEECLSPEAPPVEPSSPWYGAASQDPAKTHEGAEKSTAPAPGEGHVLLNTRALLFGPHRGLSTARLSARARSSVASGPERVSQPGPDLGRGLHAASAPRGRPTMGATGILEAMPPRGEEAARAEAERTAHMARPVAASRPGGRSVY